MFFISYGDKMRHTAVFVCVRVCLLLSIRKKKGGMTYS